MHILIAEDDLPVAKFLSSGLESEHFNVRLVTSGKDVLGMLDSGPCDLLVLDLDLPGPQGGGSACGWSAFQNSAVCPC